MSTAAIPEAIAQLKHHLDEFRSTQPRRRKLPESLWQAAVELAREHGVYSVAHPDRLKRFWDIRWRSSFANCSWGQDENRQTTCRCESGRTGPGPGRSAASAVERGRLRETQGRVAWAGGDAGAAAQHGED